MAALCTLAKRSQARRRVATPSNSALGDGALSRKVDAVRDDAARTWARLFEWRKLLWRTSCRSRVLMVSSRVLGGRAGSMSLKAGLAGEKGAFEGSAPDSASVTSRITTSMAAESLA